MTNKSTLRQIYILFAAVSTFCLIIWTLQNFGVLQNATVGTILSLVYKLSMIGFVAWASAAGRSIGVKRLGSVCGWIYVALALIVTGLLQYQTHLFSTYSFDEIMGTVQILNLVITCVDFFAIVALILFIIGCQTTTIIKVMIPILMFVSYLVSSCTGVLFGWMDIYPAPWWIFHIGTTCYLITWLTMLILSLAWKVKD